MCGRGAYILFLVYPERFPLRVCFSFAHAGLLGRRGSRGSRGSYVPAEAAMCRQRLLHIATRCHGLLHAAERASDAAVARSSYQPRILIADHIVRHLLAFKAPTRRNTARGGQIPSVASCQNIPRSRRRVRTTSSAARNRLIEEARQP